MPAIGAPARTAPASSASRPRPGTAVRPTVVVATIAALGAVLLSGHGLLVPGGDPAVVVRFGSAVVALAAVGVLVRIDGPARATRTLAIVAVAGGFVTAATLPVSPVSVRHTGRLDATSPGASPVPGDGSTVDPRTALPDGGAATGVLRLPSGAAITVEGDDVILRLGDGTAVVLGRAGFPADSAGATPGGPPQPGGADVTVRSGVVVRGDGGLIGDGVALGGLAIEDGTGRTVIVGDGELLQVPEPLPTDEVDAPLLADGADALLAVLLGCFALLAFAPPLARFAERLQLTPIEPEPEALGQDEDRPPPGVEEGLAEVLRSMLADPDPRTAVIGAYARMLAALAEVGFPRRAEEGPHEHLWRALGPLGVRRAPLHKLAELFVQARFTPRPLTEEHRQAAIGALADAVADLRLPSADLPVVEPRSSGVMP